ncbi:MAG: hypothetical protein JW957_07795 [Candidatus Omnitrophica bacterium]|nr:hypothetical protein [Candidatus Omnitrophota bacterium]
MNKRKLFLLVVLLAVFAELRLVYFPQKKKIISLNKLISAKEKDRDELSALCVEYASKKNGDSEPSLKIAEKNFSLFSYAGKLIEKQNLERSIAGIQPLAPAEKEGYITERTRLSLKGTTLKQLYDFLYEIEVKENAVYISDFRMRRDKEKPAFLTAEIELAAVKTSSSD